MLTQPALEAILQAIPRLSIGVLGDLFLDRYLDIDGTLTEASVETGLDAYQVVRVRPSPGAAGTIINNLAALGVKEVYPIAIVGDDGEGHELRAALRSLKCVRAAGILSWPEQRTPTYTKPMLCVPGESPRELNRLDIKNRLPLPEPAQQAIIEALMQVWPTLDAVIVLDQVSEADCGVVSSRVRAEVARLGATSPDKLILADSRERIGQFSNVWLKPNRGECQRATGVGDARQAARILAERCQRPVFCTVGEDGILVIDPRDAPAAESLAPALAVNGPIDPVGAGDSVSAALACAIAAGATLPDAAAFANLVASITIQQIGTTGTASRDAVRQRAACGPASS